MDQQLIVIVTLFGFRSVVVAKPAFDNFWAWTMNRWRLCACCLKGNDDSTADNSEDNELQLQEMGMEMGSPSRRSSEENSGTIVM